MFFNSIDFALFLPIVFILYWFVTNRSLKLQNLLIVGASYFFYGWWDWRFLSLILFSTIVDYLVGLGLKKENDKTKRKALLWTSILVNLGFLGFFKYYNFFLDNFVSAFSFFGTEIKADSLNIVLPVGISFYTFQTLSYTIDVYKGKLAPTKDFISFSAFVSFFPQLVAGPIERASNLLPQFYKQRQLSYANWTEGLNQILWGLFKKIVIADRLAIVVNEIYNYPDEYHGFALILGTVFFAFQIYCDFSGYSQIAIGTAKLFGFDLMKNFDMPYVSRSLGEFWRRWHISLSTWFRDYVYIPLGGNQTSKSRWYLNILIVFVVSGFWHGAKWNFIIWGAIHGVFLILESAFKHIKLPKNLVVYAFQTITIFTVVCFGWIFFRANSLGDALYILNDLTTLSNYSLSQISLYMIPTVKNTVFAADIFLSIVFVGMLVLVEFLRAEDYFYRLSYRYRLPVYILAIWSIFILGAFEKNEFIYFQF
ncbi:MAG: alginate O-acetyltransferase complex protein AlgI [Bacteroidia bacterium]|jgi:alginate O-acetyltransferase complex protein AlgI